MEFLLTLALASAPVVITPSGVELERLVDTTVQLPGTTDPIVFDGPPPFPCGQSVVFRAAETSGVNSWAYRVSSNGVETLVDGSTPIPGSMETFEDLAEIRCLTPSSVAFLGWGATVPSSAYRWSEDGNIELIQSGNATIEGRDFGDMVQLGVDDTGAALLGRLEPFFSGEALIVKPFDGDPVFVADDQIILPGQTEPVTGFTSPRPMGGDLVFRALTFLTRGLYRWSIGEGITALVDDQTPVPGYPGTFQGVGQIATLSNGVAFGSEFSGGVGIFFVGLDGAIEPLVLPGQLTVGGETLLSAHTPSGSGLIAFRGTTVESSPAESVFARTTDGSIHRLLGVQDEIEGETVLLVDAEANQHQVVVRVLTTNLMGIIYRASFATVIDVPTISNRAVAALVLFLALAAAIKLHSRT